MKRLRGMWVFPLWAIYWLIGLGLGWLVFGWMGGGGLWFSVIAVTGVWGFLVGRRYANVKLEPWSKERGLVLWAYRRKQKPSIEPRLVWDEAPPAPITSPEVPPTASEVTLAAPAMYGRPRPFPPHPAPAIPSSKDTGHKTCPDCAETVLAAAKVCRYCHYRFDRSPDPETPVPSP